VTFRERVTNFFSSRPRISLLQLIEIESRLRHGNANGVVEPRGRYESRTKAGPGRRHRGGKPSGRCQHGGKWLKNSVRGH
jgi:hypothetical protein